MGAGWTEAEVAANCDQVQGQVNPARACSREGVLGRCGIDAGTDWELQIVVYGADVSALISGESYYLYVSRDVGLPITRCLFEYHG